MTIGQIIKKYREERGLSQRQFATLCNVSNGYISMLEKEKNPKTNEPITPSLPALKTIARAMNVSLNELLELADDVSVDISNHAYISSDTDIVLTERERALIIAYRNLNDEGQKKINDYLLGRTNIRENRPFTEARELSDKDRRILVSYHSKPEMQSSVDKLLDISEEKIHYVKVAARNGGVKEVALTDEELERLKNLPDVDDL